MTPTRLVLIALCAIALFGIIYGTVQAIQVTTCLRGDHSQSYANFTLGSDAFLPITSVDRVIFIGIDGLGERNLGLVDMPTLDAMFDASLYTKKALIDRRNWSGPNWQGVLTGYTSDDCGGDGFCSRKTIWDVAQERDKTVAMFSNWEGFEAFGDPASRVASMGMYGLNITWVNEIIDAAQTYDFTFIHVVDLDIGGHHHSVTEYQDAAAFYETNLLRPIWDFVETEGNVGVVLCADHGTLLRFECGSDHDNGPVPFLAYTPGITSEEITSTVSNNMAAGILARMLGVMTGSHFSAEGRRIAQSWSKTTKHRAMRGARQRGERV